MVTPLGRGAGQAQEVSLDVSNHGIQPVKLRQVVTMWFEWTNPDGGKHRCDDAFAPEFEWMHKPVPAEGPDLVEAVLHARSKYPVPIPELALLTDIQDGGSRTAGFVTLEPGQSAKVKYVISGTHFPRPCTFEFRLVLFHQRQVIYLSEWQTVVIGDPEGRN